jgi:caffeoyl-CoA O-methyltransferase
MVSYGPLGWEPGSGGERKEIARIVRAQVGPIPICSILEGRMFSEISDNMKRRMKLLEDIDKRDRNDGTERLRRLRQITPETGKFLALLASNCPEGNFVEVGTSAGYSTMWISLAAKERTARIKTIELLEEKIALAKETFQECNIAHFVELIEGDALSILETIKGVAFCFLDCEKELYERCWDSVSDNVVEGGIIIADNALDHYETIKPMIDKAMSDERFDSLLIPIGNGELLCRRK